MLYTDKSCRLKKEKKLYNIVCLKKKIALGFTLTVVSIVNIEKTTTIGHQNKRQRMNYLRIVEFELNTM